MIWNKIKTTFKAKPTILIVSALFLFVIGFSFLKIYQATEYEVKRFVLGEDVAKTYAPSNFGYFYETLSMILFMVVPLAFVFSFQRGKRFQYMEEGRTSNLRLTLSNSLSFSLLTSIVFFLLFFVSLTSFYLVMGFDIEPFAYRQTFIDTVNSTGLSYPDSRFALSNIFWMNNGNWTYLYYIFIGLSMTLCFFFVIFLASTISYFINKKFSFMIYIISYFVLFFVTSLELDINLNIVNLGATNTLAGQYPEVMIFVPLIFGGIALAIYGGYYLVKRFVLKTKLA